MKNPLQSVLDTIGKGAQAIYSTTPPAQLAKSFGQGAKLLAPTVNDLHSAYDKIAGGASSFVQQNPTPASYVARQVPQIPQYNPVQTFQENARLYSQPIKSITQETPAARFLINKIGGPASDLTGKMEGPQTVGNYLGSNIEKTIFNPAVMAATAGGADDLGAIKEVFKRGINPQAMARGGLGLTALTSALSKLKGEKITPEDVTSSFITGSLFVGLTAPKPMTGLATTELASARKALGEYGFKLNDFSDPTILKTKFRDAVKTLHPDRGGNPEEFKAFIDAFNKSTSAGIDSGWKFSNITDWIKNLWPKEQPKPESGSITPFEGNQPSTVTTGAQNPILDSIPESVNKYLTDTIGKTFETATKSQARKVFGEGLFSAGGRPVNYVAPKPEIFQKITDPKQGIEIKEVMSQRPALLYGGVSRGILTDGYIAILDPQVAVEAYKPIFESEKKRLVKEIGKSGKSVTFAQANKMADEQIQQSIDQYKTENFPKIENVIPSDPGLPSFEQAYTATNGFPSVVLSNGQAQTIVNADKYAYLKELFPNATFSFSDAQKAISVVEGGKIKALIMPVRVQGETIPFGPEIGSEKLTAQVPSAPQDVQTPITQKKKISVGSIIDLQGFPYEVKNIFTNSAGTQSVVLSNKNTGRELTMPTSDLPSTGGEIGGITLYHGTNSDFNEFSLKNSGQTDGGGFLGEAMYLSSDAENARSYGKNLIEARVKLDNPLVITDNYSFGAVDERVIRHKLGLNENASVKTVTKTLKDRGYDGVIVNTPYGEKAVEVAVLDPTKVKIKSPINIGEEVGVTFPIKPSTVTTGAQKPIVDINKALELEQSIKDNVLKIQKDFLDGKITMDQRKILTDKEFARDSHELVKETPKMVQEPVPVAQDTVDENILNPKEIVENIRNSSVGAEGTGVQGKPLAQEEILALSNYFKNLDTPNNKKWFGKIVETWTGDRDVVLGVIEDPRLGTEYLVMGLGNKDPEFKGIARVHGTPLKPEDIKGDFFKSEIELKKNSSTDISAVEPSQVVKMPKDTPVLPRELQGAKPTYKGTHSIQFESDLDKAAYIIANPKPSKRDGDYLNFVMGQLGVDRATAREYGKQVVSKVADLAKYSDGGTVTVAPILSQEAPKPEVAPTPEIPAETADKKLYGFTKNVLKYDTAKDELKNKIQADIQKHFYEIAHNDETKDAAQRMIDEDEKGTLQKVLDPEQRSTVLNAAAQLLMNKLQYEGKFDTATQIELVAMEKALRAGQEGQIFAIWQKMTPDGRLHFARKVIDAAKKKMGVMDRVINGTSGIEEAPLISQKTAEEFNKANIEAVDEVLKGLGKKLEGKKIDLPPEELLGNRVNRYVKSLQSKPPEEKEKDPVQLMVNTLYNVARELLPDKTPEKQNPLEFVADAIKNREKYGAVWELAQKIVQDTFKDNPQAIDLLDNYFAYIVGKPFSTKTLNEIVGNAIKNNQIDIANVVRDFYVDLQKRTGETLAYRLSEEAGLSDDDALELEKYITGRFNELTQAKKEQILSNMIKEHPKLQEKTFIKKLLEFSNMGAFSDKKYYDLIAKKLNIPNVSDEMAQRIYSLTQEMQALPIGSEERKVKTQQVMNLISEQIPDTMLDIFDAYRKNNMLSGPRTQMRNAWDSILKGTVITPARLAVMAAQDFIGSSLLGEEREYYMKMVPQYYKGYINSLPSAIEKFKAAWKGGMDEESPTLREMKFAKLRNKYPKLTWIGSAMEAVDQFNLEMIAQGLSSAFQSGGMDQKQAYEKALEITKRDLYKAKLDPSDKSGQGSFLSGIDALTSGLMKGKSYPILGTLLDVIVPFVPVPVQFAKQTLEYSPLVGHLLARQASKERSKEQQAKANIGTIGALIALSFAVQGLTTWETPKDKKERGAGYDTNWKPYSIKIGSAYISMQSFGPFFLALAFPAALRYYAIDSPTAKTDTNIQKTFNIFLGVAKAYSSLTFMSNIGNFFKAVDGSYDVTPEDFAANIASSLSPMVGLTRYLATLVDPVYRKSSGFWDSMKTNYPFLTKTLEPYTNLKGEESKRNISSFFAPYDIGIENPEARYLLNQRRLQERYSKTMTFMLDEIGVPDTLTKGTQEYLDYLDSHEESQYAGPIQTLKTKIEKLGSDEFKLYANKELSTEEKNAQFEDINSQQDELLKQVDELYQEARGIMGKKPTQGIFDQVEAANYAEDFKDLINKTTVAPPTKEQQAATLKKLQNMTSVKDKYKTIRGRYDLDYSLGKDNFDNAIKYAQKIGISPEDATYDWYSAQTLDERRVYIDSLIESKTGNEVIATLASLRKKSEGTGNMILTDQIINDLVDEGVLTKGMGTKLKKLKLQSTDTKKTPSISSTGGSGGTTKAEFSKLRTLYAKHAAAANKPIKLKKTKTPKITLKNMSISGNSSGVKLKAPSLGSIGRLKLRVPKFAKIKIPKSFRGFV